jgi:hypothetical protein
MLVGENKNLPPSSFQPGIDINSYDDGRPATPVNDGLGFSDNKWINK